MKTDCPALNYCMWAIPKNNRKVPKYVKIQCRKWKEIYEGKNKEAYFDDKIYAKICKILKLIIHPDLQKPLRECMEPYAWFLITAVFCTRMRSDKTRYYRTALLEICRKNFKTFYAGVIFIIGMLTEGQFARFFSVAPDLKLSKELQLAIRKLIKSSPALDDPEIFKNLRSETRCPMNGAEYTPLAYSDDKMDGKMANIFLADEAGAMDDYPVEAMRSSQITLKNKLGIIISTQYPNDDNVFLTEIEIAKKTLDGVEGGKRRYFALLYEPDDDLLINDEWMKNDFVIYQSNPVAVDYEYIFDDLKDKRETAILYESKRENFLCKHCNIRFKSLGTTGYIDILFVKACRIENNPEFWRGKRVWLGLDLSQTEDNTAVAMVTLFESHIYAKVWGFIPGNAIVRKTKKENVNYKKLIADGVCFACGENTVSYNFVEEFILSLPDKYGVEIVQLGFDRYNAISTIQKLESAKKPIECVEIKQHSSVLHAPTKLLKEQILDGQFRYETNGLLENSFENARCTEDTNLNKYVNKKKSAGKVDCVVSVINAVFLLQVDMLNPQAWGGQSF